MLVRAASIWILLAAPSLCLLSPLTYLWLKWAQLAALAVSLALVPGLGRRLSGPGAAFWWGAGGGVFATAVGATVRRLPAAEAALAATLPGVPPAAVHAMLTSHWILAAVLSALINGGLFGVAAWYLAWWGRRRHRLLA
ncbi:MAG: hypothetical protein K6U14_07470 [Firmicutes bacterium]|nr:hypothetical protein [Alicyclobacillaceae bacterium]MCL6497453.1 hypothetical protein [Bacillota bacterium]